MGHSPNTDLCSPDYIQTMDNLLTPAAQPGQGRTGRMNFNDLANLLDNDGNLQNEMMVASFAATMLATIPVLLGNEFDVNVGLRKKRSLILSHLLPNNKEREKELPTFNMNLNK